MCNIEKFGHELHCAGPGTAWRKSARLVVPSHRAFVPSLLSDSHYHVFAKCGYVLASIKQDGKEVRFWRGLYRKMQLKRCGIVREDDFLALIRSFQEKGFDKEYPIPVGVDVMEILDGSHRLAISLAISQWPFIEMYRESSHAYNRSWFEQNGFSDSELQRIDGIRDTVVQRYRINHADARLCIVWGNALDHWEEILEMLSNHTLRAGVWFDLFSIPNTEKFVIKSYIGDGMITARIEEKASRLAQMSTRVGVAIIEDNDDEVSHVKKQIRERIAPKLPSYFFDSIIHVVNSKVMRDQLFVELFHKKGDPK